MGKGNAYFPGLNRADVLNRLGEYAARPVGIAILLTILAFWLMPQQDQYNLVITDTMYQKYNDEIHTFKDLNNNGETELIRSFTNPAGEHAIWIETIDGIVINQWNFRGKIPQTNIRFFFGDYDQNGMQEIYLFTYIEDSVFLHYFEPFGQQKTKRRNIFIDKIPPGIDAVEFYTVQPEFYSLENLDQLSLFFGITAGYAIQPRRLYRYDIQEGVLIRSATTGIHHRNIQLFTNNNHEGPLLLTHNSAPGNLRQHMNIPFSDSSAWLTLYDQNLDFVFDPIPFPGFARNVFSFPVSYNHAPAILLFTYSGGICDACTFLSIYDLQGNLLATKNLDFSISSIYFSKTELPYLSSNILVTNHEGEIFEVNERFEFEKRLQLKHSSPVFLDPLHFQMDKNKEVRIFPALSSRTLILIMGNYFEHTLHAEIGHIRRNILVKTMSIVKESNKPQKIFIQGENKSYFINIIPNPMFRLQWFLLIGIFVSFYGLFFLSRRFYKKQLLRNQAAEKEMLELQFQSVSNQINPHFIFNALNAITASIYKENKEDAFAMGARFSALMRETLTSSEKITRSLENELEFVRNYLEIERFRFKNNFDYTISIGDGVDLFREVPKMIIQTFAEKQ